MKLRTKFFVLGAVPLAISLVIGSMYAIFLSSDYDKTRSTLDDLAYLKTVGAYASQIQLERGTAGLVLSGGAQTDAYQNLFAKTDAAEKDWNAATKRIGLKGATIMSANSAAAGVVGLRSSVLARTATDDQAYDTYTYLVDTLLKSGREAIDRSSLGFTERLVSLVLLEEAKEWMGRCRALVSVVLDTDAPITPKTVLDLIDRYGAVGSILSSNALSLSQAGASRRDALLLDDSYLLIGDTIDTIVKKSDQGRYGESGSEAFDDATAYIKLLQDLIDGETAAVSKDLDAAAKSKAAAYYLFLGVVALVILGAAAAVAGILLSVSGGIKRISAAFGDIAGGEGDLRRRIEIASRDELGVLAGDFNAFAESLAGVVVKVKSEATSLSSGMDSLSSNMTETAGAVQEIAATIESIRLRSAEQSRTVAESVRRVEGIGTGIESLANAAASQEQELATSSSSIEELVASIRSVNLNVDRVAERYSKLEVGASAGRDAIRTVSEQARDIGTQSEGLSEANQLISSIASRTDLLAMNAAIEAAHAGEFGKGFAVVADEIRNLAEGAAEQSKAVSEMIATIAASIEGIVNSSQLAETTFETIAGQIAELSNLQSEVKYAMDEQNEGSAQTLVALGRMKDAAGQVRSGSDDMREDARSVLGEMEKLTRLTRELDDGMKEMSVGAAEIRQAAAATSDLTAKADESVRALAAEMDKFRA